MKLNRRLSVWQKPMTSSLKLSVPYEKDTAIDPRAKQFAIEVPRNRMSCPSNRSKQSQETDSLYRRHTICAAKFEWQVVVCKSMYVAFHSNFTAYIVCWRYIHDISYVSFLFCFVLFLFCFLRLFVCLKKPSGVRRLGLEGGVPLEPRNPYPF